MAVKLRLKRTGRKHLPCYRLNDVDSRAPRDGRAIEELGLYDPLQKDPDKQINFKRERIEYWLSVGAQPTRTVADLLEKAGILAQR